MNNNLNFRLATKNDLSDIIKMLADDNLGAKREKFKDEVSEKYVLALENIIKDPNHELTTDKERPEAINFYFNIAFLATHEGMKIKFLKYFPPIHA